MNKNCDFHEFNEMELTELELLYWKSMSDKPCQDIINTELKLVELYCSGKYFFQKKQDFINLIINKINNSSNFFKKIYNTMLNTIEISNGDTFLMSKPFALSIRLTHKCNVSCQFCECHKSKWEISKDTHKQILELMPFLHEVGWTGGEVFLYKNFYELFNCAKLNNVHQEVITNSMLLNEKWLDEILTSNVKLAISVRSVNKERYEMLSKGALFEKLIDNLEYIKLNSHKKHKNFELAMYILVTKYNFIELEQLVELANFYGFDTVRFIQLNNREDMEKSDNICDVSSEYYKDLLAVLDKAVNKAKKYNIKIDNELPVNINYNYDAADINHDGHKNIKCDSGKENRIEEDNKEFDLKKFLADIIYYSKKTELFCRRPWNSMLISNDGGVIFNCFCFNERNIGNSSENTLIEIWNSDMAKRFRKKILDNTYADVCNSICVKYGVHK